MMIRVRGAKGLNLAVHSMEIDTSDPEQAAFLVSCRNIDLSIGKAVMPRAGMQKATSWPGLLYDEATGGLFTGITSLTGPITVMFPDPSAWAAKPTVGT
jgi:hypothetical protein